MLFQWRPSDWFLRWAGTTDLNSGTRGGLLVVRYFGTGRSGDVQLISSQSCSKKGVAFFLGKKYLTFQCLYKHLAIFNLTGMFGHFFSGYNCEGSSLKIQYLRFKNYDTCTATKNRGMASELPCGVHHWQILMMLNVYSFLTSIASTWKT